MTKPQIKIVDCTTKKEVVRDANDAEIAQIEQNAAKALAEKAEAKLKEKEKAALLSKLGITAKEAALLLS